MSTTRSTSTKVINWLVGSFCAIALVVFLVHNHRASSELTPGEVRPTPNPSVSESPTSGASQSPPVDATPTVRDSTQLLDQASRFVMAYYLVLPTDTLYTWRQRLREFGTSQVVNSLASHISPGTAADDARLQDQITLRGVIANEPVIATDSDDVFNASVVVQIRQDTVQSNGAIRLSRNVLMTSAWHYSASTTLWTLKAATENGAFE